MNIPKGQTKRIEESDNSHFVSYAEGVNTYPGDETALVIPNPNKDVGNTSYFILNGDWIEEYQKCTSKDEQIQLFRDNYEEHAGFWTDSIEELDELLKNA